MELVNLLEAARRTGISQRTLWGVLTNHLAELPPDRRTQKRPSRDGPWEWNIDLEELHALLAKHKPHLLRATSTQSRAARGDMEAEVRALKEQIARLQAQLAPQQPVPGLAKPPADRALGGESVAVNGQRVANDLPGYHTRPTVPVARKHAPSSASMPPAAQHDNTAAWASGRRSHELYSQFWTLDSALAKEGLLLFQTWGTKCGLKRSTIDSHRRRQAEGKMPADLSFTDHEYQPGLRLRYVNAVQRGAWLTYWQELGHVKKAPTEADVQEALDVLASWT